MVLVVYVLKKGCTKILTGLIFCKLVLFLSMGQKGNGTVQYPILEIHLFTPDSSELRKSLEKVLYRIQDSTMLKKALKRYTEEKAREGYLEFAFDSVVQQGQTLLLRIHKGPYYCYKEITIENIEEYSSRKGSLDKLVKNKDPFAIEDLEERIATLLAYYQENGYPFASIDSLKASYHISGDDTREVSISYVFHPGKLVTIDSIQIEGKIKESPGLVHAIIGIRPGDLYNESLVREAHRSLNNSPYYKNAAPAEVRFKNNKATVKLKLSPRKTGKFDLLFGILPPKTEDARLEFTGLADIKLVSPFFHAGESFSFRYDKLVGSTLQLNLNYSHPYLAGTPLQIEGDFQLFKQDTSFLTRRLTFSAAYKLSPSLTLKAWYRNESSSLISTLAYQNDSLNIPPVLDSKNPAYGIGFQYQNLDYIYNPSKGVLVRSDFGLGNKKIRQNGKIPPQIYEKLNLQSLRTEVSLLFEAYISPLKRWVIKLANQSYYLSLNKYFENDLKQTGGSRTIRGFNENEFFASRYAIFTLEQRYLLERNTYFAFFTDYGYLEAPLENQVQKWPFGIGIGMAYETKAGIVSLSYAIGKVNAQILQPATGRIHIGLINQF